MQFTTKLTILYTESFHSTPGRVTTKGSVTTLGRKLHVSRNEQKISALWKYGVAFIVCKVKCLSVRNSSLSFHILLPQQDVYCQRKALIPRHQNNSLQGKLPWLTYSKAHVRLMWEQDDLSYCTGLQATDKLSCGRGRCPATGSWLGSPGPSETHFLQMPHP